MICTVIRHIRLEYDQPGPETRAVQFIQKGPFTVFSLNVTKSRKQQNPAKHPLDKFSVHYSL